MFAQQVGPKVCQTKTEAMTLNVPNRSLVKVKREDLPTTEEFTYLSTEHCQAWRWSKQQTSDMINMSVLLYNIM